MTGIYGVLAYQQANRSYRPGQSENAKAAAAERNAQTDSVKENKTGKTGLSPFDSKNSLVPKVTEYGNTIGDVKLSDQAKDYLSKLKSKFHNMEFITVSRDTKSQVQANAASYGNANKQVVLIDEDKIERMAADESFRKKYEGIISMSGAKLTEAKNSLASSGANVRNFGISVDANGKESFFAAVDKANDLQKKRIEKKAAEKKEQKRAEKKKAEKQEREDRIQRSQDQKSTERGTEKTEGAPMAKKEAVQTFESDSLEGLLSKVREFSYQYASDRVMAEAEKTMGTHIDFKG